ncbi:MAG: sugar transferase [Fibrobacter sp.]|nr:sugar transferase [Fibrobacter sp.]
MYARFLKRPLDFCCALAAILALSPLLLVLTVLGAVKMHGNPFFTQPRPGKGERIFRLDFILGGSALPRRHALFYGPASRLCHPAHLVKRGQAPLALLAAPVSAPTGHDRCRETLGEAA